MKTLLEGTELDLAIFLRTPVCKLKQAILKLRNKESLYKPLVHNLTGVETNLDMVNLLSLGGNFILTPTSSNTTGLEDSIRNLSRSLILRDFFGKESDVPPLYAPGSKSWMPATPFAGTVKALLDPGHFTGMLDKQPVFPNLNRSQFRGLFKFKQLTSQSGSDTLMTVNADKNMGLCLTTVRRYSELMNDEINRLNVSFLVMDNSIEEHLVKKSLQVKEEIIKMITVRMRGNIYKLPLLEYLKSDNCTKLPTIHGLPKLHKPGNRMRLLLPFHKNIFTGIHKFVAKILQPLAFRESTSLTSSIELVHYLEQFNNLTGEELLVTADLDNMYNNITVGLAIDLIIQRINQYLPEYFMFGTDPNSNDNYWRKLIDLSLSQILFKFQEKFVQQVKGVPMGSPFGPVMAIITVNSLITREFDGHDSLLLKKMYIDDGFFIFKSGTSVDTVEKVLQNMINHPQSDLQWDLKSVTVTRIKDLVATGVTFLDLTINSRRTTSGYILYTSCYFKPLGSYQYLHWKSCHPKSCKRAVATGELSRRMRLSTFKEDFYDAYCDLTIKLLARGYPLLEIEKAYAKFNFIDRVATVEKSYNKIIHHRYSLVNPWTTTHPLRYKMVPLVITYDPRYHRSLVAIRKKIQDLLDNDLYPGEESYRVVIAYKKRKPFVVGKVSALTIT